MKPHPRIRETIKWGGAGGVLLAGTVGALITIGVAWLSATGPFMARTGRLEQISDQDVKRLSRPEWTSIEWRSRYEMWNTTVLTVGHLAQTRGDTVAESQFGWPCRAMGSWIETSVPVPPLGSPGTTAPPAGTYAAHSAWNIGLGRAVPLMPVWPGFAIDAVLYGAIAWSALVIPGFIRRSRRRAEKRCVWCGYELAGLADGAKCPECDTASQLNP